MGRGVAHARRRLAADGHGGGALGDGIGRADTDKAVAHHRRRQPVGTVDAGWCLLRNFHEMTGAALGVLPLMGFGAILVAARARARYVRVRARNFGRIPDWHPGRGSPAFIFVDEITVE